MTSSTPIPYVPVDGRPYRLAMGLRPLDLAKWFEFGSDADDQLAQKAALVATQRREVVAILEEGRVAAAELASTVALNLATFHPSRTMSNDIDPLVAASLSVPDDLCVMAWSHGEWRLVAACVCFPSRWSLAEKVGASLDDIHAPVPHFDDQLSSPTSKFFDRLDAAKPVWRLNWTLLDDPALFQPGGSRRPPHEEPGAWRFRVERQSLVRLASTGAVAFTIRTYVARASEVAASEPEFVSGVATVLRSAPADTLTYKGWSGLADRWNEWFN
jgi:hypothetical protein